MTSVWCWFFVVFFFNVLLLTSVDWELNPSYCECLSLLDSGRQHSWINKDHIFCGFSCFLNLPGL